MQRYIRYILIVILAVLLFGRMGSIMAANYDGNQALYGLYHMDENTVDVMFYGSSHIYAGVNTVGLWDEYGIAGFDLAGTMQTLWNSYYNMEESLKYQTPKVMVVDLYGALIEEEYSTSTNVIKNASNMKFSINKVRNIWASVSPDDFLTYLLSYPLTHGSYRTLGKGNYIRTTNQIGGEWYKGFKPSYGVTKYDSLPQVKEQIEMREPTQKNVKYLEKMVQLTKEKGIQLVFIVVPYAGVEQEDEAIYLWIKNFAMENDILFLDGNCCYEEMKFDALTDFAEASHLNYNGACKFTDYLGEWLKMNCSIEDRRGDARYNSWKEYSDIWSEYQKNQELVKIQDIDNYIDTIKYNKNYIIFLSLDNNYGSNSYIASLEEMIDVDLQGLGEETTLVIEEGKVLYQTPKEPEYLWYMETESMDIAVVKKYGERMDVVVNSIKQNNNYSDVSILIYDKKLDMVVDSVKFNYDGLMIR